MRCASRITLCNDHNEKFFGDGPARLLRGIRETGSLRAAAMAMGMAYPKALRLLKNAEAALGFPLTSRSTGGRDGGGSTLTAEGEAFLARFEAYRDACCRENHRLFREYFPQVGCVILASGLGRRFGGNKLMAPFHGGPMIARALAATQGVFSRRVVVTRHPDVAAFCRERGVEVLLHDAPHRSDTLRLGLEALGEVDACLFCPGDQPLLTRDTVAALVAHWQQDREAIWRPQAGGTPGAPVLFPGWALPALRALPQGQGGSWLIARHPDRVRTICADPWQLRDADTPEILEELRQAYAP